MRIKNYSRIQKRAKDLGFPKINVPNLLAMQIDSYGGFLQKNIHPQKREKQGLQFVFEALFPIQDSKENYLLEFIDYSILKNKYSTEECLERNLTFQAPVKARMKLTVYDEEIFKETGEKQVKKIIEQDVFLGEIPIITPQGTFIINGAERVIISQLHRSPVVFFTEDKHLSGKMQYSGKVIPYNGSWLEFSLDIHDTMYVHIDKRRKLPVTVLLRTVGISTNEELREAFYTSEEIDVAEAKGRYLYKAVNDKDTGSEICAAGLQITEEVLEELKEADVAKLIVVSKADTVAA
ncbi:MAG: hypothetical protein K8S56_05235, partial [Candidatus Cloacimonetes bacterium]|nr:hypothetical protein [Candidatus Cloacimonadota bacterium]